MSNTGARVRTVGRCAGSILLVLPWLAAHGAETTAAAASGTTSAFREPVPAFETRYPRAKASLYADASDASAAQISKAAPAATASQQVVVTGAVESPLALGIDDLKAFPAEQIASVSVPRRGEDKGITSTVRGVRLTAVLERAGLAGSDRNQWKHTAVVAVATDGYRVVFSWPELFNTEVGAGVLVVFERDGALLGDREGRIALISTRDLRRGPRSVKWLARLDVKVLTE